jgi:hypothetical protein
MMAGKMHGDVMKMDVMNGARDPSDRRVPVAVVFYRPLVATGRSPPSTGRFSIETGQRQ